MTSTKKPYTAAEIRSADTNTGTNLLPLCTAKVWPTNSGVTVLARDHVFITRFSFRSFIARTFFCSASRTYGPFFTLLAI